MNDLSELIGKTLIEIKGNKSDDDDGVKFRAYQTDDGSKYRMYQTEELVFKADDGSEYRMFHDPECCESVTIEDIVGDLTDLIGSPILKAEENSNSTDPPSKDKLEETYTWTFYNFATIKGHVTIRWFGTSNGYYSDGVSFEKVGQ